MKNERKISASIALVLALAWQPLAKAENPTPAADLLEQGVYLQEAEGQFAKAIEIYRSIVEADETRRAYAAEAQFRLAVCLLEQGNRFEAAAAFEALVDKFPDQEQWTEAALAYMPKAFKPLPPPWVENERTALRFTANGNYIGHSFMRIQSFEWEGRQLWKLDHRRYAGEANHTSVEFDKDSFLPAYSHWRIQSMGNLSVWYDADQIRVEAENGKEPKTYPIEETIYDNEQVVFLFRQMPLEIGYSELIHIFTPFMGITLPLDIKVEKMETIETGIGAIECYRVDMPSLNQSVWITADEKRYVAKLEVGQIVMTLDEVTVVDAAGTKPVFIEDLGARFEIPQTWEYVRSNSGEEGESAKLHLFDPDSESEFVIQARRYDEPIDLSDEGLRKFMNGQISGETKRLDNFYREEGTERIDEQAGARSIFYEADFEKNGEPFQFQKSILANDSTRVMATMVFPKRVEGASYREVYENVVASMQFE